MPSSENIVLCRMLAETRKSLREARDRPASVENGSRDPRRLYEDDNPIAVVQDPKADLGNKKIIFPVVNCTAILGINKMYEFRTWKLACRATQLYTMVSNGLDMITLILL